LGDFSGDEEAGRPLLDESRPEEAGDPNEEEDEDEEGEDDADVDASSIGHAPAPEEASHADDTDVMSDEEMASSMVGGAEDEESDVEMDTTLGANADETMVDV
jgi:hypothetical protein